LKFVYVPAAAPRSAPRVTRSGDESVPYILQRVHVILTQQFHDARAHIRQELFVLPSVAGVLQTNWSEVHHPAFARRELLFCSSVYGAFCA
jgi:hypothetical protein